MMTTTTTVLPKRATKAAMVVVKTTMRAEGRRSRPSLARYPVTRSTAIKRAQSCPNANEGLHFSGALSYRRRDAEPSCSCCSEKHVEEVNKSIVLCVRANPFVVALELQDEYRIRL